MKAENISDVSPLKFSKLKACSSSIEVSMLTMETEFSVIPRPVD